ncbi:MAG: glycosyltransferase family 2 protein [Nitrospirae bacterium]|nr:glycosyltransferase family 2 protein [Nitrospirota bacterium]
MKRTLSVVMPNYNDSEYLTSAIESVVSQSYPPDEFIICDDASTDNSVEIIKGYAARFPLIKFVQNETNLGVFKTGLKLNAIATGDYIFYLNADDYLLAGFLEKSMRMLEKYPDAGFCAAFAYVITKKGRRLGIGYTAGMGSKNGLISPAEALNNISAIGSHFLHSGTMVFKRIHYKESERAMPDKDVPYFKDMIHTSLIIAKHGLCFISEPLVCIRMRNESLSASFHNNPELYSEAARKMAHYMRTEYPDVLDAKFIDRLEKNIIFWGYFNSLIKDRNSVLKRYKHLKTDDNLFKKASFSLLNRLLFGKDAIACIGYLVKNRLGVFDFLRNYGQGMLYQRGR